ncbi:hydratase [uncultured Enterovirga sp.]|uniref:hydratase n=1 Tax=uncultured Enterovirga sp. TaxID=2026352 RepID=UPI0035CC9E8B
MGSVFSPYYALARRRGRPDPLHHCAVNVALYGISGPSWSCTERGHSRLHRAGSSLTIGPSSLEWVGSSLEIRVDEVTAPWPRPLEGVIRVHPQALSDQTFDLDGDGRHRWFPISPCARVEVALTNPELRWSGHGYLDANDGDEPLADAFSQWHWSRATMERGTAVLYDVVRKDGAKASVALRFDPAGGVHDEEPPPPAPLPRSLWRVDRETRSDGGSRASVRHTLEDGPFYARSVLQSRLFGEPVTAMHESLSLDRFSAPWVQAMLPFRMPRRAS